MDAGFRPRLFSVPAVTLSCLIFFLLGFWLFGSGMNVLGFSTGEFFRRLSWVFLLHRNSETRFRFSANPETSKPRQAQTLAMKHIIQAVNPLEPKPKSQRPKKHETRPVVMVGPQRARQSLTFFVVGNVLCGFREVFVGLLV